MKRIILCLSLLTLSFGLVFAPAVAFALTAEEEEKVDLLVSADEAAEETAEDALEEEEEEEEFDPASIIPVAVACGVGLVLIVALNLAGKKK